METPKAKENLAKDVETKVIPMPQQQEPPLYFALPGNVRLATIEALQSSSPKQLSVSEVNKICNDLSRLRPIHINEPPKEKPNGKK